VGEKVGTTCKRRVSGESPETTGESPVPPTFNHGLSPDSECAFFLSEIDYHAAVQPADIQQIGDELAIKWDDGRESFIALESLRRHCPCAGCQGERDIMGNLYKGPEQPLTPRAFQLMRVVNVGGYAIQPIWADGHATGIFSFDYLWRLAAAPPT
jgi:DUF971 family protein